MKQTSKLILSLIFPALILGVGVLIYFKLDDFINPVNSVVLMYLPYVILTIGMLLSLRFNRSRVFFIMTVLLMSLFTIGYMPNPMDHYHNLLIYLILGVVVPLNLVIFAILKERGFLTLWGVLRFFLVFGQFAFIYWILHSDNTNFIDFLYGDYPWNLFNTSFPYLVILTMLLSMVLLIIKTYLRPSYSDPAFILTLVAVAISLRLEDIFALLLLFSALGIILIISIIQDSYRMSYLDELTGLPGRRALKEAMMKLSGTYTIAMVDIDFFKKFNDKHGHDIGDEVLKMVASCLNNVRGGGKAFRYGGEEFTILFPGKGMDDSIPHLETLRETVAKRAFILRSKDRPKTKPQTNRKTTPPDKKLYVTISIGVANRDKSTKSPQEVMKNADKALYRAKKKGRNCVSK